MESIQWLPHHPALLFLLSIGVNIVVAISGVLPSTFITAANITLFGFNGGLFVSIIGEAAGAVISFTLYRKGLKTFKIKRENKFLQRLEQTKGGEAVFFVLFLRIIPFVPSGAVTLAAAFSQMSLLSFSIASTIGKIPSLLIEAYSVQQVLKLTWQWQLGLATLLAVSYLLYKWRKG
ncbi:VTT domain-containing protein [Bacillus sp. REN10]|uniref:TVP38/TMEM64 family protein n=1 Tax=Bacillus sp. REN10 TaxID=2782541 RepID=UPI00193BD4DE|nr:VTT domain-containing protein [Bacillus sp. REN10]